MTRFEYLEKLLNNLGDYESVVNALVRQMSDDEMEEAYKYIARMYDFEDEDEDEDEDEE